MTPQQDDRIGVTRDEPEFEPIAARPAKKPWGRHLAIMLVLIVGGAAGWHYLGAQIGPNSRKSVPVIRADVAPVKIKPADPGGLDIPDRDKLVYDRLNGEGAGTDVETLLPPPEEPMEMPPENTPDEDATGSQTADDTAQTEAPDAAPDSAPASTENTDSGTPQAPVSLEPSTIMQAPQQETARTGQGDEAPPPPPPPPPVPVEAVETQELGAPPPPETASGTAPAIAPTTQTAAAGTAATTGSFRIQLAALRTHAGAEAEWDRLRKAHPDILGPFNLFVVMVDKGGDGIYYRLQAGHMASRASAKAACDVLAKRKVACLVKAVEK